MYDQYVNETLLADNGVRMAMCHHDSIDQEEQSQKFCDLINEVIKCHYLLYHHTIVCIIFWITFLQIERQANSNPLFTQSKHIFFLANLTHFSCPSLRYLITYNNCRLTLR